MGGEINVAYDGTSADLFGSSDSLQDYTWDELCSSTESLLPANNFTAINSLDVGTISPKDLLMDGSGSVPPSTAFTDLTTPGSVYLTTPTDTYETSPMFDSLDAPEVWPSLFAHEETSPKSAAIATAPQMTRTVSSSSAQVIVHPGGLSRKRPSTSASPAIKLSTTAGIRKRDKELPPIIVNSDDAIAVKRARNTAAARKSRDKKFQEVEAYKAEIAKLQEEVEYWKALATARTS